MGREPIEWGWKASRSRDSHGQRAKSGDGRQEQGQPWAESQRRERKASRDRATGASAYARDGQQQGNRGKVLTHGTDDSRIAGAECLRTERTARQQGQRAFAGCGRQQGSRGREPSQGAEGSRAAWAESLRRVRKAAGQQGQRAFAGVGRQQGSRAESLRRGRQA